jgi:phosphate-selective porin OprO/OprP
MTRGSALAVALWAYMAASAQANDLDLQPTFMAQVDEDTHAAEGTSFNGFELQRLRLGLRAEPTPWFVAVGVFEYADEKVSPFEVYAEATALRSWHLSVGFRRTPLFHTAKDDLIESLPIPELSLPTRAMWPGVDLGAEVHYTPDTLPIEGWFRIGNGSQSVEGNDGPNPAIDARLDAVVGRARPGFENQLWGFRAGAGMHAKNREDTTGLTDTTPDGFLFYHPAPTNGWQVIGEGHIAGWWGPLSATLEGGLAREERLSEGFGEPSEPPIYTRGAAFELAWMVRGAPRPPGQSGRTGDMPQLGRWPNEEPWSWDAWRGGSIEVAARLERVDLEYNAANVIPGGAQGGAIAIDWWATRFAALSLAAYDYQYFRSPLEDPGQTNFWLVLARTTVSFR